MSISIKENIKPNLTVCKMNCDGALHTKLDAYELTKYLNTHTTTLMLGKPRSGKTSMLYSLFERLVYGKAVFKCRMTTQEYARRIENYHTYYPIGIYLCFFITPPKTESVAEEKKLIGEGFIY